MIEFVGRAFVEGEVDGIKYDTLDSFSKKLTEDVFANATRSQESTFVVSSPDTENNLAQHVPIMYMATELRKWVQRTYKHTDADIAYLNKKEDDRLMALYNTMAANGPVKYQVVGYYRILTIEKMVKKDIIVLVLEKNGRHNLIYRMYGEGGASRKSIKLLISRREMGPFIPFQFSCNINMKAFLGNFSE